MTEPRTTLADRAHLPEILWPEDVAVVLGLPSARAAREFVIREGVPHTRVGTRVFVLSETLLDWFREHQERHPSRDELRERADEVIRQIAPTARDRQRGRKPPRCRTGGD